MTATTSPSSAAANSSPSLLERRLVVTSAMLSYCIDAMLVTIATPIFPHLQSMLGVNGLQIGYLFAMKAVVQLLADPLLAPLANRGHNWLISLGLFIEVATSASMSFATSFSSFLVLRGLQGIASAMIMTTGMSWVARVYAHNDKARGNALSVVMMGVAVGVAIGPTVGGLLFEVGGLRLTFLAMAILAFIVLGLNLLVLRLSKFETPVVESKAEATDEKAGYLGILSDGYMWIVYGSILVANGAIGMLEPTLGMYMGKLGYSEGAVGLSFLGYTVPLLLFCPVAATLGNRFGRPKVILVGLVLLGVGYALISASGGTIWGILLALSGMGVGMACNDAVAVALLVQLVDLRHDSSMYGSTYAFRGVAECIGYVVGPLLGSGMMGVIGFPETSIVLGCSVAAFAPLLLIVNWFPGLDIKTENEEQTCQNSVV